MVPANSLILPFTHDQQTHMQPGMDRQGSCCQECNTSSKLTYCPASQCEKPADRYHHSVLLCTRLTCTLCNRELLLCISMICTTSRVALHV